MSLNFKNIQEKVFVDIPSSEPKVKMLIPRVGISNRPVVLKLQNPLNQQLVAMQAQVKIGASLDAYQRGIHMSRIEECMEELKHSDHSPGDYALALAKLVKKTQGQKESFVELVCTLENPVHKNPSGKVSTELITLHSNAFISDTEDKLESGVTVPFMNACPCTQRWAMRDFYNNLRNRGLDEKNAEELVMIAPLQAHTNGGMASLLINDKSITHADIYAVLDKSVPIIREMLKGMDEHAFVTLTHKQGQFCEDNIRAIAHKTLELLEGKLDPESMVKIKVEVNESVHFHNLCAEIDVSFDGLRHQILRA